MKASELDGKSMMNKSTPQATKNSNTESGKHIAGRKVESIKDPPRGQSLDWKTIGVISTVCLIAGFILALVLVKPLGGQVTQFSILGFTVVFPTPTFQSPHPTSTTNPTLDYANTPDVSQTQSPTITFTPTTALIPAGPGEFEDPQGTHMIFIASGKFTMGRSDVSPKDDDEQNVKPAHEVYLSDYYIDKYEVTNGAYAECVKARICKAPYSFNSAARTKGYYSDPTYTNFPVIYVDWFMANEYCEWRDAHLPTEAEWEKAARSNNNKNFPWGQNLIACPFAQYGACGKDTVEVGSHPNGISPFGIHDMAGNVWEWVADWYGYDYYDISPSVNPHGPASGNYRVARGGGWNSESIKLRVTYRNRFNPGYSSYSLGFRCARNQ